MELDEATLDLLGRATRGSRYAKGIGKQTLYAQMDLAVGDAYGLATDVMAANAARGDGAEWPKAFIEKRPPRLDPHRVAAQSVTTAAAKVSGRLLTSARARWGGSGAPRGALSAVVPGTPRCCGW